MVVGLKCTNIDWEKSEITLSVDNLREVRENYMKLYNDNLKRRGRHDPEMMRWTGMLEVLGDIIGKASLPVTSEADSNTNLCPVPPITCELGRHWEQPNPQNFVWDNDCVAMTKQDYEQLHTYDCTNPTGIYEGKMWKCHRGDKCYLKYVADCPGEPDYCTIHSIELIVI